MGSASASRRGQVAADHAAERDPVHTLTLAVVAICLVASIGWPRHVAAAQADFVPAAGTPPEVGASVFERSLTERGTVIPHACPSGRGAVEQTTDGVLLRVRGKCNDRALGAAVLTPIPGLVVPDGEVRLELKVVSGGDRAGLLIQTRSGRGEGANFYSMAFAPTAGEAEVVKIAGQRGDVVATRSDLKPLFLPDGWNTVAVRMEGARLWLFVNDRPVIAVVDATHDTGGVALGIGRSGNPDDSDEAAVLIRNLKVSSIAGIDAARAPSYRDPATRPSRAAAPASAPTGAPPAVGLVVVQSTLVSTAQELVPLGSCDDGTTSIESGVQGVVFRVRGQCEELDGAALVETSLPGITIPDGELRFEMKPLSGGERAAIYMYLRNNPNDDDESYAIALLPATGSVLMVRTAAERNQLLGARADVPDAFKADDWNSVSVRLEGSNIWLLVNDQVILAAVDSAYESGGVALRLVRVADDDEEDDEQVAVVVRNLRVSSIAGGDPSRVPTYEKR